MTELMIQLWKNASTLEADPAACWPDLNKVVLIQLRDGSVIQAVVGSITFGLDGEICTMEPVFVSTDGAPVVVYTPAEVLAWGEFNTPRCTN